MKDALASARRFQLDRFFYWLAPLGLLLAIYWPGLEAWFQADDFAWLGLWRDVTSWHTFLVEMFEPLAQGTIRPWSERGFFLLFHLLFGADALPWRIFVFGNAAAVAWLLMAVARQLTGSRIAALAAALVWIVTPGLPVPMAWSSDYNQIQCSLFLLAALWFHLKRRRWAELVVFLLGFGSLEINVVYPALALACDLALRQPLKRSLLRLTPLFALSVAYFLIHSSAAPTTHTGPYAMHFDRSVFKTLFTYWKWALVAPPWAVLHPHLRWLTSAGVAIFSAALAAALYLGRRVALFGLVWFFITLAPLLPLRNHVIDYYLTIPAIGLAIAVAAAACKLRYPRAAIPALALIALYIAVNAKADNFSTAWWTDRSERVRILVEGVVAAERNHPGQGILLDGLSQELLESAIAHSPFHALNLAAPYLSPETKSRLTDPRDRDVVDAFTLPPGPTLRALDSDGIVVYQLHAARLVNVTNDYESHARLEFSNFPPERVDVANPFMAYLLGPGWYQLEGDHRWMSLQASVQLGGPSVGRRHLELKGWCPEKLVASGPVQLTVALDGNFLSPTSVDKPEAPLVRIFDVPATFTGRKEIEIAVRVSRTFHSPGDPRALGLAFGVMSFEP